MMERRKNKSAFILAEGVGKLRAGNRPCKFRARFPEELESVGANAHEFGNEHGY
jgi:hypothetical protein